ncbi:hypothetical protein M405DRAFT_885016 [Rhizopogon salebrosus TDB-379]|nr:hypothetical protein M405DRAFT_885016 [Rhizopogon salebrosus TDB-379]
MIVSSTFQADATQRPAQLKQAHRTPQDFFDDARDGVHCSDLRILSPPRRVVLILVPQHAAAALSYPLHCVHHGTDGSPEIQQSNRQIVGPHAVEVGPVRDKQSLYVAGRPERRAKRIENPTWWIRCILLVCCVPRQQTDSHQ